MEIAWELAQHRMSSRTRGLGSADDEQYKNLVKLYLSNAWEIVDESIPDASKHDG